MDKTSNHKNDQSVLQVEIHSTPSPNTHILLPSGIILSGIDEWVTKLANVA